MNRSRLLNLFLMLLIASSYYSQEEKRLALVIGNANYEKGALKNPVNDANLVSTTLKSLDFEVLLHLNVETSREMKIAISEFGEMRKNYDVGFVFYAGHGIQVDGENYLIPTKEIINTKYDVEDYGVSLQKILRFLKSEDPSSINFLILDACRDNPFELSWSRSAKGNGLAKIPPPSGSLIAFSTDAGMTAEDGDEINSTYTKALAKNMLLEDISIEQVFKNVRTEVLAATNNRQSPVENSKLTGNTFYLNKTFNIYNSSSSEVLEKYNSLLKINKISNALELLNKYADYVHEKNNYKLESTLRLKILLQYFYNKTETNELLFSNNDVFMKRGFIDPENLFSENLINLFMENLYYFVFDFDEKYNSNISYEMIELFFSHFYYTYGLFTINSSDHPNTKLLDNFGIPEMLKSLETEKFDSKNQLSKFFKIKRHHSNYRLRLMDLENQSKFLAGYDQIQNHRLSFINENLFPKFIDYLNVGPSKYQPTNQIDSLVSNSFSQYDKSSVGNYGNVLTSYNDLIGMMTSFPFEDKESKINEFLNFNNGYFEIFKQYENIEDIVFSTVDLDINWFINAFYNICILDLFKNEKLDVNLMNYSKDIYIFFKKVEEKLINVKSQGTSNYDLLESYNDFAVKSNFRASFWDKNDFYILNKNENLNSQVDSIVSRINDITSFHLVLNEILENIDNKIVQEETKKSLKNFDYSPFRSYTFKWQLLKYYLLESKIDETMSDEFLDKMKNLEINLKIDRVISSNLSSYLELLNSFDSFTKSDEILNDIDFLDAYSFVEFLVDIHETEDESEYFLRYLLLKMKLCITENSVSYRWPINELILDARSITNFANSNSAYILRMNTKSDIRKFSENIDFLYNELYSKEQLLGFKKKFNLFLN